VKTFILLWCAFNLGIAFVLNPVTGMMIGSIERQRTQYGDRYLAFPALCAIIGILIAIFKLI